MYYTHRATRKVVTMPIVQPSRETSIPSGAPKIAPLATWNSDAGTTITEASQ